MTRSLGLEVHLDEITKESFVHWLKHYAFNTYASSTGKNGFTEIGTDGVGNYAVRITHHTGMDTHFYNNAGKAIKAYKEQLS